MTAGPEPAAPRSVWSPGRRRLTVGLLVTVATGAFETLGVGTVMPAASAELQDLNHYGLVFSAFMLAHVVGIVAGGLYAERSSPERAYMIGALVFACGLLVTGTADSMVVVALGRALQGLGAGAGSGLGVYAVQRCYDEHARPRMLALFSTAFVVPGLLGPSLAAGVNELVGWRWVFLGIVPLMPLAALLVVPVLRATAAPERRESDARWRSSVWPLTAAAVLALVALSASGTVVRVVAAVPAVVLGAVALSRVFPGGIVRFAAGQPAALAFIFWGAASYYSIEAFLPLALTSLHGTSIVAAGLVLSAGTVLWSAGTWLQARLVTTLGGPRLLALGAPVLLAGVAVTGLLMATASIPFPFVGAGWAVVTLGMGLTSSTATLVVLQSATEGTEVRVASSIQLATLLGGAVGTGLAGLRVTGDADTLTSAIGVIAVFAAVCAVLGLVGALRSRTPATT